MDDLRLDKWLWAARFYKTRSLAQAAVEGGLVKLNGERAKPARALHVGDRIDLTRPDGEWSVTVLALSGQRGPAAVAQRLYEESEESLNQREALRQLKRLQTEPAADIAGGRPTKQARRALDRWRQG